jgi:mono/diheme cytochrome c family protein
MKTLLSMVVLLGLVMVARPAMADDAAALYKSKCQVCHGPDGKGTAAGQKMGANDFQSPEVQKASDADLIKITKDGKDKMPKYDGKLTDDQIKGLIKYIRTLK